MLPYNRFSAQVGGKRDVSTCMRPLLHLISVRSTPRQKKKKDGRVCTKQKAGKGWKVSPLACLVKSPPSVRRMHRKGACFHLYCLTCTMWSTWRSHSHPPPPRPVLYLLTSTKMIIFLHSRRRLPRPHLLYHTYYSFIPTLWIVFESWMWIVLTQNS